MAAIIQTTCINCNRMYNSVHVPNGVCTRCRFCTIVNAHLTKSPCPCGEPIDIYECQLEIMINTLKELEILRSKNVELINTLAISETTLENTISAYAAYVQDS